jgi:alkylation response protein AidB-like acyl-CoA dehydrogenase
MTENFYLDNQDLQYHLDKLDLREVLELKEKGYSYSKEYPTAPRSYEDAKDNYRLLLEVLGEICGEVIAPRAAEADEEGAHFEDGEVTYAAATQVAIDALKHAELNGAMLPWKYGGLNLPETIYAMLVELISRAEGGFMTIYGLQEIASTINEYGDEDLKERVLPPFSRGEFNGAMVLTEADAGSDLGAVQTKATYDEETGKWYLNGTKRFITNGCADIAVVLARSEEGTTDARGLSIFYVKRDETVTIRRIEHKLGIRTSPTCEIHYNNTPAELIGKRRFGLIRYGMALMNGARLAVSAQALGIAEAAYREAYDYAHERSQFKKPIKDIPAVARMLLSLRSEIEAARALIYETGRWVDLLKVNKHKAEEEKLDKESKQRQKQIAALADVMTPLAKYYSTEMGNRVAYQAVQIHGGVGYMKEFNVERHYRDVRITNIYEGTSQLQIVAVIGKLLGHGLDDLLDGYAGQEYGPELEALKAQLVDSNEQLKRATDHLKEQERDIIDYYASDLADMAVYTVNSWLLLQDARTSARKKAIAEVYIAEHLPMIHQAAEAIQVANATPLEVREAILDPVF